MASHEQFKIGLVLGGSVSAGAYTAGVLDYLNEALTRYYEEKGKKGWSGPVHEPYISVMSGTSGGAVNLMIYLYSLAPTPQGLYRKLSPVKFSPSDWDTMSNGKSEPPGAQTNWPYQLWVKRLTLERLTQTEDLDGCTSLLDVPALLCTPALEEIATEILHESGEDQEMSKDPAPYLARDLEVFITTTNIHGNHFLLEYSNELHGIADHKDHQHLIFEGIGDPSKQTPPSTKPSHFKPLSITAADDLETWKDWVKLAIASSTVPFVFQSRWLSRKKADYQNYRGATYQKLSEIEKAAVRSQSARGLYLLEPENGRDSNAFLNMDGGIFNNEPLDFVSEILWPGRSRKRADIGRIDKVCSECSKQDMDRALILIDPFKNSFGLDLNESFQGIPGAPDKNNLLRSGLLLACSILNQGSCRLPTAQVQRDSYQTSCFAITPDSGEKPLTLADQLRNGFHSATAALFGFRGFWDERLRRYDFQLGRRNCQRFLQAHFLLDQDHPLVKPFHDEVSKDKSTKLLQAKYGRRDTRNRAVWRYQIIPLVDGPPASLRDGKGHANKEQPLPRPELDEQDAANIVEHLERRVRRIATVSAREPLADLFRRVPVLPRLAPDSIERPAFDWAFDKLLKCLLKPLAESLKDKVVVKTLREDRLWKTDKKPDASAKTGRLRGLGRSAMRRLNRLHCCLGA